LSGKKIDLHTSHIIEKHPDLVEKIMTHIGWEHLLSTEIKSKDELFNYCDNLPFFEETKNALVDFVKETAQSQGITNVDDDEYQRIALEMQKKGLYLPIIFSIEALKDQHFEKIVSIRDNVDSTRSLFDAATQRSVTDFVSSHIHQSENIGKIRDRYNTQFDFSRLVNGSNEVFAELKQEMMNKSSNDFIELMEAEGRILSLIKPYFCIHGNINREKVDSFLSGDVSVSKINELVQIAKSEYLRGNYPSIKDALKNRTFTYQNHSFIMDIPLTDSDLDQFFSSNQLSRQKKDAIHRSIKEKINGLKDTLLDDAYKEVLPMIIQRAGRNITISQFKTSHEFLEVRRLIENTVNDQIHSASQQFTDNIIQGMTLLTTELTRNFSTNSASLSLALNQLSTSIKENNNNNDTLLSHLKEIFRQDKKPYHRWITELSRVIEIPEGNSFFSTNKKERDLLRLASHMHHIESIVYNNLKDNNDFKLSTAMRFENTFITKPKKPSRIKLVGGASVVLSNIEVDETNHSQDSQTLPVDLETTPDEEWYTHGSKIGFKIPLKPQYNFAEKPPKDLLYYSEHKFSEEDSKTLQLIQENNIVDVYALLRQNKLKKDTIDDNGNTLLHYAAVNGSQQMYRMLLRHKYKGTPFFNQLKENKQGMTPAYLFGLTHSKGSVFNKTSNQEKESLIRAKIYQQKDINAKFPDDSFPLLYAANNGFADLAIELLDGKFLSFGGLTQYLATENLTSKAPKINKYIQEFKDTDTSSDFNWEYSVANSSGLQRLQAFLEKKLSSLWENKLSFSTKYKEKIADYFNKVKVEAGVLDPNQELLNGTRCVHLATYQNNESLLNALLRSGADVNAKKKDHSTCLHIASKNGHTSLVRLLLSHDANINETLPSGFHCGLSAVEAGNMEVVKLLIEHSTKKNAIDFLKARSQMGENMLMLAIKNGHRQLAHYLIQVYKENGLLSDILLEKNYQNDSAFHLAGQHGMLFSKNEWGMDFQIHEPDHRGLSYFDYMIQYEKADLISEIKNLDVQDLLIEKVSIAISYANYDTLCAVLSVAGISGPNYISNFFKTIHASEKKELLHKMLHNDDISREILSALTMSKDAKEIILTEEFLKEAIKTGSQKSIQFLLDSGVKITEECLHEAVNMGNMHIINDLLYNINAPQITSKVNHQSVLDIAAKHGNYRLFKFLVERGAPLEEHVNVSWLLHALVRKNPEFIIKLTQDFPAMIPFLHPTITSIESHIQEVNSTSDESLLNLLQELKMTLQLKPSESMPVNTIDSEALQPLLQDSRLSEFHSLPYSLYQEEKNNTHFNKRNIDYQRSLERAMNSVNRNEDINSYDNQGYTMLANAVRFGLLELTKELLSKGANPNILSGKERASCFQIALKKGNNNIVQLLLDHQVSLKYKDNIGRSNSHYAAWGGNLAFLKKSIHVAQKNETEEKDHYGKTVMHYAALGNQAEAIQYLFRNGFDINATTQRHPLCDKHSDRDATPGRTPLHLAVLNRKDEAIKMLCDLGADVFIQDIDGNTAFDYAILSKNSNIINFFINIYNKQTNSDQKKKLYSKSLDYAIITNNIDLIKFFKKELNADLKGYNSDGITYLQLAVNSKAHVSVHFLLTQGADANMTGRDKVLPLRAAASKNAHLTQLLLDAKADIQRSEALHSAATHGKTEIVESLIKSNADVNQRNTQGQGPLEIAVANNRDDCVKQLLSEFPEFGKSIEIAHYRGFKEMKSLLENSLITINKAKELENSPLHEAISDGHDDEKLKLLLQNKSLLDAKNKNGDTPLHLAIDKLRTNFPQGRKIIQLLLSNGADLLVQNNAGKLPIDILQNQGVSKADIVSMLLHSKDIKTVRAYYSSLHRLPGDINRFKIISNKDAFIDYCVSHDLSEEDITLLINNKKGEYLFIALKLGYSLLPEHIDRMMRTCPLTLTHLIKKNIIENKEHCLRLAFQYKHDHLVKELLNQGECLFTQYNGDIPYNLYKKTSSIDLQRHVKEHIAQLEAILSESNINFDKKTTPGKLIQILSENPSSPMAMRYAFFKYSEFTCPSEPLRKEKCQILYKEIQKLHSNETNPAILEALQSSIFGESAPLTNTEKITANVEKIATSLKLKKGKELLRTPLDQFYTKSFRESGTFPPRKEGLYINRGVSHSDTASSSWETAKEAITKTPNFVTMDDGNEQEEANKILKNLKNTIGEHIFKIITYHLQGETFGLNDLKVLSAQLINAFNDGTIHEKLSPLSASDEKKSISQLSTLLRVKKSNEKSIKETLESFSTASGMTESLPQEDLRYYGAIARKIRKYREDNKTDTYDLTQLKKNVNTLKESMRHLPNKNFRSDGYQELLIPMMASIMEAVSMYKSFYPNTTQIIALLGLLDKKDTRGCLAQIKTGEGKTLITAMLASVKAIEGNPVDIVSSSHSLAQRDSTSLQPFYDLLDISVSHACEQLPGQPVFSSDIVYGVNSDFEFVCLRDQLEGLTYRKRSDGSMRPHSVVIIDEVDNILIDKGKSGARIGGLPKESDPEFFYELVDYVQKNREAANSLMEMYRLNNQLIPLLVTSLIRGEDPPQLNSVYEVIHQSQLILETITQHFPRILDDQEKFFKYLPSAIIAVSDQSLNSDYIIEVVDNEQTVVLIEKGTGEPQYGCRLSNGIHECLEAKHHLKVRAISGTIGSISHTTFFNHYEEQYGVTGTVGTDFERIECQNTFKLNTFDVPPHCKNKQINEPPVLCTSKKDWHERLEKEIKSYTEKGRPILMLFSTINECLLFSDFLKEKDIKHHAYTSEQVMAADYIIACAGRPKAVTLATNNAGRGTDILLSDISKQNGGLHVVTTFYPENTRVEGQANGRSARQGQPGSCRMIIDEESDLFVQKFKQDSASSVDFQSLQRFRDKCIEEEMNHRVLVSQKDHIKYQYFTHMMHCIQKLLESSDDSIELRILQKKTEILSSSNTENHPALIDVKKRIAQEMPLKEVMPTIKKLFYTRVMDEWDTLFTYIDENDSHLINTPDFFQENAREFKKKFCLYSEAGISDYICEQLTGIRSENYLDCRDIDLTPLRISV